MGNRAVAGTEMQVGGRVGQGMPCPGCHLLGQVGTRAQLLEEGGDHRACSDAVMTATVIVTSAACGVGKPRGPGQEDVGTGRWGSLPFPSSHTIMHPLAHAHHGVHPLLCAGAWGLKQAQ